MTLSLATVGILTGIAAVKVAGAAATVVLVVVWVVVAVRTVGMGFSRSSTQAPVQPPVRR
jgi:tellurite resistance protein TehA-like permease